MDATAVATVGATTMVACQIVKRMLPGDWDAYGVHISGLLSMVGVLVWVTSAPAFPPARTDLFSLVAGWLSVYATAVGIYESAKLVTSGGGSG